MDNAGGADDFLVERIRAGDQSAWRLLIDRYSGRLHAFARARAPTLSDAEDLVQDTFVGFLQSLGHYDPARSLETYLFTIVRYKLYDILRQKKLPMTLESIEGEDWWDHDLADKGESPSGAAALAEDAKGQQKLLGDILRQLIHELRDRSAFQDLQVIELVFFAGRRNLDIAELLDMDQKAVAGVKFRAIQKLQKFLSELDPSALSCLDETHADVTVPRVWREQRLTCLKRGTLGSYLVGVLEEPWLGYTQFHLDVVGCPLCVANVNDLQSEREGEAVVDMDRYFQSSVGFLSRPGGG